MGADERNLVELAVGLREKGLTPEQRARREWVARRNKGIQEFVKAPKSGTFGKGVPDEK